jgi:hypothetical protein
MVDSWEEAALEAAVEVVEEDPQLAEYKAWEEVALVATVDAFVADEQHRAEVRLQRECRLEVGRQQEWEQIALRWSTRQEQQRQDEVYERRCLADMQL